MPVLSDKEQDLPQTRVQAVLGQLGAREICFLEIVAARYFDVRRAGVETHLLPVPLPVGKRDPPQAVVCFRPFRQRRRHETDVDVMEDDPGNVGQNGLKDKVEMSVVLLHENQPATVVLAEVCAAVCRIFWVFLITEFPDRNRHHICRPVAEIGPHPQRC